MLTTTKPLRGPYGPPAYQAIVRPNDTWPHTTADTLAEAERKLATLRAADPAYFASAEIMLFERFEAKVEARYLDQPIRETNSDDFHHMLEVIPPLDWRTIDGVERFNLSEMTYGRITQQWARCGERYFTRYARHGDRATYLTASALMATFPDLVPS